MKALIALDDELVRLEEQDNASKIPHRVGVVDPGNTHVLDNLWVDLVNKFGVDVAAKIYWPLRDGEIAGLRLDTK